LSSGEKYLAAVYLVVLATVLVYVAIISAKLARLDIAVVDALDEHRSGGGFVETIQQTQ